MTGVWDDKERARSKRRLEYFRHYNAKKYGRLGISLGYLGELFGIKKLKNSTLVRKSSHDIEWNGKKVEVKTATLRPSKKKFFYYQFSTWRQRGRADYFLLICVSDDHKRIIKAYLVPDKYIDSSRTLIRPNDTKYERFRISI